MVSAQLSSLSQELTQLQQRHEGVASKLIKDAAASHAQVAELKQWFDENQVGVLSVVVCVGMRAIVPSGLAACAAVGPSAGAN